MILSNVETDDTILLSAEGETKNIVMLTDTSTVPYSAYYDMPDGYVPWLTITANANVFSVTAKNNLFSETGRSQTVRFHCIPTSGATAQTEDIVATQAADTLDVAFDPTGASLAYTQGATASVAVSGVPTGAYMSATAPEWLTVSIDSETALSLTADLNTATAARTGSVILSVNSVAFYLPVTQAANTLALTFDPTTVSLAYTAGATDDVTVTGVPAGASVTVNVPSWLTGTFALGVLTLTATLNTIGEARSASVEMIVNGRSFYLVVTQAANPYPNGRLVLNESSHAFDFSGGSVVVSATEMPPGTTTMDYSSISQGNCTECGNTGDFVTVERVTATSFKITTAVQDIFDGIERSFVIMFSAGTSTAQFTVTQHAPPAVHRFIGTGDKFLKSANSLQEPSYLAESTTFSMYEELKRVGWSMLDAPKSPLLVGAERDNVPTNARSLEAYKACHSHVTAAGTTYHKVSMGAAAYRFVFSAASYGLILRGIRFKVRSDAYCVDGLRISLQVASAADSPSTDWNVVRDGTDGNVLKGFVPRVLRTVDNLYYGANGTVVFDGIDTEITAATRLYVYVTIEDYRGVNNGWVYGSGIIVPTFDFYADDLIFGLNDDDVIASATVEHDSYPLVADGDVISPKADEEFAQATRELASCSVVFGHSPLKNDPTPIAAATSVAFLASRVASGGMAPVSLAELPMKVWQKDQVGLTCSVCRQIIGATPPFDQRLALTVSPMLIECAMPSGYVPSIMRLTHRAGQPTLTLDGVNVRLSVYWIANTFIDLQALGRFFSLPGFAAGEATLKVGEVSAVKVGEVELPNAIAATSELVVGLSALSSRWGTFMLVPWVSRVTAQSLTVNAPIGLLGALIEETQITGTGWVPDVQLEV